MIAAARGLAADNFSIFSANGGKGIDEQRAHAADDALVDDEVLPEFTDASFEFTNASLSWAIGLSFEWVGVRLYAAGMTG